MKKLGLRLIPGSLLVGGATVLVRAAALQTSAWALIPAYPYVVFGAGILLGWRFNRRRLVLALLALGLAEETLLAWAPVPHLFFSSIALLLPINLAALSWMTEGGVFTPGSRWGLGLILAQALGVLLLSRPGLASAARLLDHAFFDQRFFGWTAVPQLGLLAFALALVATELRFILRPNAIEGGFLWALFAAFLALTSGVGLASAIYLATGGLVLVVSLIETSHTMAYVDELTGLPARRALNEALAELRGQYTIAMVDLDHFKKLNDTYGHAVGDQLLKMVAITLERVGGGGRPFRYGGEEFAVLFPGKSLDDAVGHLEILRKTIESSSFVLRGADRPPTKPPQPKPPAKGGKRLSVTVSIGAAAPGGRGETPDEVLKAADQVLYRAKRAGRNRLLT